MPPSMLDVLITTPVSPDAIMRGTNDSMPLATPKPLTEKHQAQSLGSCSQGRPPPPEVTPALLNSRWQAPSVANTSAASASTEGADETSVTTPRTVPSAPSSLTVACSTGSSTSAMTTRAPSSSSASAMPRPMPAAPPVTTATLPFRSSNACPQFSDAPSAFHHNARRPTIQAESGTEQLKESTQSQPEPEPCSNVKTLVSRAGGGGSAAAIEMERDLHRGARVDVGPGSTDGGLGQVPQAEAQP